MPRERKLDSLRVFRSDIAVIGIAPCPLSAFRVFRFLLDKKDKQIRTDRSSMVRGWGVKNSAWLKTRAILTRAAPAPALRAGFGFGFCRREDSCAERTRIDPPWRECERGVATESPSPSLGILVCSLPKTGTFKGCRIAANGTIETIGWRPAKTRYHHEDHQDRHEEKRL